MNAGEGRVDVAVTVNEGARYVVRTVQTTGVESTREATVERATRIEPGSPASPAVAEATRRRALRHRHVPLRRGHVRTGRGHDRRRNGARRRRRHAPGVEALPVPVRHRGDEPVQSLFDQRVTSGGVAADLRDRNFLGRGWTLGAGIRYEPSFRSARVLASVPRLRSKRIRTNIYVGREQRGARPDRGRDPPR